jgi:hypothetical protein
MSGGLKAATLQTVASAGLKARIIQTVARLKAEFVRLLLLLKDLATRYCLLATISKIGNK